MLRQRNCIENSRIIQCYTSSSFFHISAFFFIFYSQVSHSFRSTLLTPSWQSAMQGMEEEENQDDGFRSPMKRCTSQPPWADQTDVSWCQLMSVVSAMYNQVTFKSHSNQFNSKHRARYGWWRSKFEVIQSEISYKMYQNVAHLFKSARLEGSLKVVVCCSHAFVKYSQHFSDFWGGIPRTMWHVATAKSTATWNHQFSQQLVSDKTLSTQRGQSYGGPL